MGSDFVNNQNERLRINYPLMDRLKRMKLEAGIKYPQGFEDWFWYIKREVRK